MFLLYFFPEPRSQRSRDGFFLLAFFVLVGTVGFRYKVGCDWGSYELLFLKAQSSMEVAIGVTDPGYSLINWLVAKAGGSYITANVTFAILFSGGLLYFVRSQPLPLLALAVAIPYVVIVVGMGYQRQSIALAFLMVALVMLGKGKTYAFFVYVLIGALFHKSVVLLLPLGLLRPNQQQKFFVWFVFGFATWVSGLLILDSYDNLWSVYVDQKMESEGALIRVLMNLVAGVVFFIFRKRWYKQYRDGFIWQWFAIAAVLCLFGLTTASTAVDRMALYLLPLQIVVFARVPAFFRGEVYNVTLRWFVLISYAAVLYVWLNFAISSFCWIPYRNVLFE